jgi:UDP-glucose 4-epimerase
MASLFITGVSGYIGGQVLKEFVHNAHGFDNIRVLVRGSDAATTVKENFKGFSEVEVVTGDLDDDALVEEEASKASVVLSKSRKRRLREMISSNVREKMWHRTSTLTACVPFTGAWPSADPLVDDPNSPWL